MMNRKKTNLKTVPLMVVLLFTFLSLTSQVFADGVWNIITVDVGPFQVGRNSSIALDADGYAHISYTDSTFPELRYAAFDGSSWHIENVDVTGQIGVYTSIALDSSGNPHISYYDATTLRHAGFSSTWFIETVDTGGVGQYPSIAMDSSDNPHISYYDATQQDMT